MTKIKLQTLVKQKVSFPTNGYTQQPYQNTNYHNLNKSVTKNKFPHNIWMSENQCIKMGITVIDKNNPSQTIDRFGNTSKIFNISQTDFIKPTVKKVVKRKSPTKTIQTTQLQRIERLEKLVVELYGMIEG